MGSCVSIHRNEDSVMKFRVSMNSKAEKVLIPSSPTKETINMNMNGDYPVSVITFKSQTTATPPVTTSFRDFGSKEETFFDSQAWLDSDCDDDFLSVNGDFTPSRGNTPSRGSTPVRQNVFFGATQLNKSYSMEKVPNAVPEPSPTGRKKRLSELFQESSEVDQESDVKTSETPYVSGANSVCSSEKTPSREMKAEKEKLPRTVQCCMPSFVPNRRSSEKKVPE